MEKFFGGQQDSGKKVPLTLLQSSFQTYLVGRFEVFCKPYDSGHSNNQALLKDALTLEELRGQPT